MESKKPSFLENIGKVVIEFFTGKQLSKEEKELNEIRKDRRLQLKLMQEDAQFKRDMELAEKGEYIPPEKLKSKPKEENIFSNLGKYNPIEDFKQINSLGSKNVNSSKTPDFGLKNSTNIKNPMELNRRK
jgi:hypothetical protein